ncbi:MAG: hypothetical protein H0W68_03155 [Gemmatimonadaceae bacterium]|nr:hypothetical protein [Gemmatimonadaceae bacterium]
MTKTDATHPNADAFPLVGGQALRALAHAGIRSLSELSLWTEHDLSQLHGIGPKALRLLKESLANVGRHLRLPS